MSREVHVRFCESLGVQFPGATHPGPMPVLHIDLREGFKQDDVIIYLGDREVACRSDVSMDLTISYAASIEVQASEGRSALRIEVPKQHVSSSTIIDPKETPFVAIFLHDRQVSFHKLKKAMPVM